MKQTVTWGLGEGITGRGNSMDKGWEAERSHHIQRTDRRPEWLEVLCRGGEGMRFQAGTTGAKRPGEKWGLSSAFSGKCWGCQS